MKALWSKPEQAESIAYSNVVARGTMCDEFSNLAEQILLESLLMQYMCRQ